MTATEKQIDYIRTLLDQAYPGADRASYLARNKISNRMGSLDKASASQLIDELQDAIRRQEPDADALQAERVKLVARIAEIDRLLGES